MARLTRGRGVAVLAILAMAAIAALPADAAGQEDSRQIRPLKRKPGGGNTGGGDPDQYAVDVTYSEGITYAETVTGTVDDAYSLRENESPNPAPDYFLGAMVTAPAPLNSHLLTLEFSNFGSGGADPRNLSCNDFFLFHGRSGEGNNSYDYDGSTMTGTWTGNGYVRSWLDGGMGETNASPKWSDTLINDNVKVRVNGALQTTRTQGKKTSTTTELLFSLHFDDDWAPSDTSVAYVPGTAQDLAANGDGTSTTVASRGGSSVGLVYEPVSGGDWALCNVTVSYQVDKQ